MDLLVNLYDERFEVLSKEVRSTDKYRIIRMLSCRKYKLLSFIKENFSESWASEVESCFSTQNPRVFVAIKDEKIIGFSAYDATGKGFFGPVGVGEFVRGKGVGRELTIYSLNALKNDGYAYAIIGGAQNAVDFYKKFLPIEEISSSIQNSIYNRKI